MLRSRSTALAPHSPFFQLPYFVTLQSLERETGIEPATNSLEGCDSTTELLPLLIRINMLELFACVLLCANASRWSHFAQICIEFAHRQQSRVHSANRNTRTLLYVHFCVGFGEPFDLLEHRAGG